MARFHSKLCSALAGSLILAGCCSTLPVVPHAIPCNASADLLNSKCPLPTGISTDATFQTLVDAMQNDRQALRECGISLDALRSSINLCNKATEEFNKKIDDINKKNK